MRLWYRIGHGTVGRLVRILVGEHVRGLEHVPSSGGVIVASNHISFWDPPIIGTALSREAYFLAKEELFRTRPFAAMIRSVNAIPIRRGVTDLRGLTRALEVLRAGGCLIVFPEGGRMKDAQLHRAKPGLGLIVAHARVPVVPAYIAGSNHVRRCIARQQRVRVVFGSPIPPEQLIGAGEPELGRALYQRIADEVMEAIARLKRETDGDAATASGPTERGATS